MPGATVPAIQVLLVGLEALELVVLVGAVDVDVGGLLGLVVLDIVGVVVLTCVVELVVGLTVVVGGAGAVPRDGVAEQVETCSPAVRETRPSWPRGSENPAGSVPT
jgi:hypothetical protein